MACLFLFATTARASEGRSRWRRACRHTVGELAVDIARRPRRGRAELNQPVGQHEGMDVLDVTGSTVIVTGASSGIGAATARLLHEAGAHPVLAARRADRLAVLSEELDGALAVPTDVTDPTAVRRLAETTLDRHGRIDGLVNNAGVSLHSPLDRLDLDEFARVLQLNVISLVAMTQAVLPAMRARGSGRIVNISSGVRRQCRPARATPKRSASPRAAAATGTSAASSSAAALTRSACAAEALPALFAVLIATKLIGAAERASVQDRLRSLPRLRQASATLPTCASSIPCSVTSGRTAGWVACHRRPWSVPLDLPCRSACCLLYTSDAADEEDSVDLGGRRIIKKKT